MAEISTQRNRGSLLNTYASLSPFEQIVLQMLAVLYEPSSRTTIVTCLNRAGIVDPRGLPVSLPLLTVVLDRLQKLDLVEPENRCRREVVEVAIRQAVAGGSFAALARAVREEIPLSLYYGRKSLRCWRAMRDFRIAFYSRDLVAIDHLTSLLTSQCEGVDDDSRFAVARICLNPFDPEWFRAQPPSLQLFVLDRIVDYSLHELVHFEAVDEYLTNLPARMDIPADEQLPFRRLLVAYHLWRGDLAAAGGVLEAHPSSFAGSGLAGCLEFLAGRNDQAIHSFEQDLERLRHMTGERQAFFHNMAGFFFLLALLKSGEPRRVDLAGQYLSLTAEVRRGDLLDTGHRLLGCVLLAHDNKVLPADTVLRGVDPGDHQLLRLLKAMTRYWLHGVLPEESGRQVAETAERAQARGFDWIAMECWELLHRLGPDGERAACGDRAAAIRLKRGLVSVLDAVKLQAPWQRSLQALIDITAAPLSSPGATNGGARLVWQVEDGDGVVAITPKEQRPSAAGGWSKGRPVALSRLYGTRQPAYLTDQDRRICSAIVREPDHNQVTYAFDLNRALPALVGHPLIFLAGEPPWPVEFVKGEPELLVEETGEYLRLRFSRPLSGQGVTVARESPTAFKIIEVTEHHRRIAALLNAQGDQGQGLVVPAAARSQVMTAITNVSAFMTVHSAISARGTGGPGLGEVEARSDIHVQLLPLGTGFRLAMYAKPFGSGGPYLKPGVGEAHVMAEIKGKRLQTERNLHQERRNGLEVLAACPTLALAEEGDWEWHLPEIAACLELLLELGELKERVTVEWPEGQRLRVERPVGYGQLKATIRSRRNWFEVSGQLAVDDGRVVELQELLTLAGRSPGRFVPLGQGRFLALTEEFRRRLDDFLLYGQAVEDPEGPSFVRLHPLAAFAMDETLDSLTAPDTDQGWRLHRRKLAEAVHLRPRVPSTLLAELREYQVEGFVWLSRLAHLGVGACLADDMGLGKTMQALALMLSRAEGGPMLVVAPTSVCLNWQSEANRFAPTLNIILFSGRDREALVRAMGPFDVLVTSYTMLQQEAELLSSVPWEIVVLDEAQAIKNFATKRSRAAMRLQGNFKLITTGTPIENHLGELWNLFRFLAPGLLGSLAQFNERFAVPIERHQDREARRKLKRLVQPFMLRRLKSQVLEELPDRTEILLQVTMSPEEAAFYEALRRQALEHLDAEPGAPGHIKILAEIMRLRRACCNPRLVVADSTIAASKLAVFGDMVEELLENRHKALVFSQFVGHLSIIREYLDSKKITYRYLDGSTPPRERQEQVEAFQAGHGDLFLISLKAGGLGLSLTAADYVIHMDPWWNPAVEDQASDRAHRIGQQRPVTIYRLVTRGTIEEKIVKLHQEKRDLANSLLAGSDISARMSPGELLSLIREG